MLIGNVLIKGRVGLAPAAGVSDRPFRVICRQLGAAYACTEMVSAKALVYQDKKSRALLLLGEEEHPVAAQIFGSDPECMAEAAKKAVGISGADVLDINMGCPTGKIVRNHEGCALMKDMSLSSRIIESVVGAAGVPVTVKIRKGWDKGSVNAVEFAKMAENSGASAVTVHGRTCPQGYSGVADWDIIREVKKALKIPVIANGDVMTGEDAVRILRHTGADMAVICRGAFGNPWIFEQANAALEGRPIPPLPPLSERCDVAVRQFEMAIAEKGEKIGCLEARKHYAWYLRGVPHAGYYKELIQQIETLEDIYRITRGIKNDLR